MFESSGQITEARVVLLNERQEFLSVFRGWFGPAGGPAAYRLVGNTDRFCDILEGDR